MIRIDPRLVQLAERQKAARVAYDEHIRDMAHPLQWPMLSDAKQREWYRRQGV